MWGRLLGRPLFHLIHPTAFDHASSSKSSSPSPFSEVARPRSFYTAALNADVDKIVATLEFGAQSTPHIKVKLDSDVKRGAEIMHRLQDRFAALQTASASQSDSKENSTAPFAWSVDANAAWDPVAALKMLDVLKPLAKASSTQPLSMYLYMVEQPFPLLRGAQYAVKWSPVKPVGDAASSTALCLVDASGIRSLAPGCVVLQVCCRTKSRLIHSS